MGRICYSSYHIDVHARKQLTREKDKELGKQFRKITREIEQAVLATAQAVLEQNIRNGRLHASFKAELSS